MIVYATKEGKILGAVYGNSKEDLKGITSLCGGDYAVFIDETVYTDFQSKLGGYTISDIVVDIPSVCPYVPTASGVPVYTEPVVDLDALKTAKITAINTIAGEKIDRGFYSYAEKTTNADGTYKMLFYKSDSNHREQLGLLYNLVQFHAQGLFTDLKCSWKDANQEDLPCHEITDAVATQLFAECGQHLLWCKKESDTLVQQVTAATTVDAVNAIAWPDEPTPTAPAETTTGAAT